MTGEDGVSTRDIVLRLDEKVDKLVVSVADLKGTDKVLDDHEQRLRVQERFRYGIPSATIVLMALTLLVALAALFYSVFGRHPKQAPGGIDPKILSLPRPEKHLLAGVGFSVAGSAVIVAVLLVTLWAVHRNKDGSGSPI